MSPETLEKKEVRVRALGPVTPESCVLVLEELGGSRLLPIFTSLHDGEAIARQIAGYEPPRPLTHDLLLSTVQALGWSIARVLICDIKDGAFYARIFLARDGVELDLDSRPTDAVNIALRARVPIFVAERVFAEGESVLKPIDEAERKKFAEDLEKLDVGQIFAELENKPAPKEASGAEESDADDGGEGEGEA